MKALKWIGILLAVYVGIIVLFESLIGYFQPASGDTLVITTVDPDGTRHDRVLSRLESDGKMYVAVNHWPRAWFDRARENPEVEVTVDGTTGEYVAVQVSGAEADRVESEHRAPVVFRILTGFPPRYFVRLDPRAAPSAS